MKIDRDRIFEKYMERIEQIADHPEGVIFFVIGICK